MSTGDILRLIALLAPLIEDAEPGGPPLPFRFSKRKGRRRLVIAGTVRWEGDESEGDWETG